MKYRLKKFLIGVEKLHKEIIKNYEEGRSKLRILRNRQTTKPLADIITQRGRVKSPPLI